MVNLICVLKLYYVSRLFCNIISMWDDLEYFLDVCQNSARDVLIGGHESQWGCSHILIDSEGLQMCTLTPLPATVELVKEGRKCFI